MPWNTTCPVGGNSVKDNKSVIQDNITYINTTLQNDHYWDEDATKDGYHKKVDMVKQASDATLVNNGVIYLKDTTEGRTEGFYRNTNGIYQFIPSFKSGTAVINSSFSNLVSVPANVYGQIYLYLTGTSGNKTGQMGFFKSTGATCDSWSFGLRNQGGSTAVYNIRLGNGTDASGLNIRVRSDEASSGATWAYRVIYWQT